MGRTRRAGLLAATLATGVVGLRLVRRIAARAHTTGAANLTPQVPSRDPARLTTEVRAHAEAAEVDPVLLMTILHVESYKPHGPLLERAWQALRRDSAFGVANMHRRTYERTRFNRPFADRAWKELPDDPDLAIRAAAWHLHDLQAQLPDSTDGPYTRDELIAMGYNTGPRNMLRFASGRQPGPQARAYLDRLREQREPARQALLPE